MIARFAGNENGLVLILGRHQRVDADLTARLATALGGSVNGWPRTFATEGLFERAYRGDGSVLREISVREYRSTDDFHSRSFTVDGSGTGDSTATATGRAADAAIQQLLTRLDHTRKDAR
jgi:hypothetical protein